MSYRYLDVEADQPGFLACAQDVAPAAEED
jgi:hypothetical protein